MMRRAWATVALAGLCVTAACSSSSAATPAASQAGGSYPASTPATSSARSGSVATAGPSRPAAAPTARAHVAPDPCPTALRVPQQVPGSTGWVPIGRLVSGCSALYETHVGTVSIVWLDPRLLSFTLYSGSLIPGGGPYLHTAPIRKADALNLVAAFNSGFKDGDSHGGYFAEGRAEVPLVAGIASAVIYTDGTMRIGTWGSEISMTPDVVSVRQNMTLLIDNGVINPATSSEPYSSWGITWPGGPTTNRSALGVTAQGAELFAGGVGLTVPQITQAIASAGAVRAMELDENDIYPNFSIFTPALGAPASARNGTEVVPGFSGPERYFTASWNRDFFAALARPPAPLTQHRQQRG